MKIEDLIKGKSGRERAEIKAQEIAKFKIGKYTKNEIDVEIIGDIKTIQIGKSHGIEFLAKAFKDRKPLGFGKDGSVEIERFRIFNPPILVDDPNGDIVREWTDEITREKKQRKLREDPAEALRQSLAHIIGIVGEGHADKIIKGKTGNTTSTFYPDADPESTSVDGYIQNKGGTDWSVIRNATTGTGVNDNSTAVYIYAQCYEDTPIWRGFFLFDTSALPDSDTIDSATFSLYSDGLETKGDGTSKTFELVGSSPASNTGLTTDDYDQVGDTIYAPEITPSSVGWETFTLNATGKGAIEKTGITKLAMRTGFDLDDVAFNGPTGTGWGITGRSADYSGTSSDPKLVVEHSGVVAAGKCQAQIF